MILSFSSAPHAALLDLQRDRSDLVTRLRRVAAALREAEFVDESEIAPLFEFRRRFETVRDELFAEIPAHATPATAAALSDGESLEELAGIWRAEQSRNAVLSRIAGLQSIAAGNATLARLHADLSDIEQPVRSRLPLTPQVREFAEGTGPLAAFEQLVTRGHDLTDERWDEAHQQVREAYGVAVASAAARGRIVPVKS